MEPQFIPPNSHAEFKARLEQSVAPVTWQTWLQPLRAHHEADILKISAPSEFHRRWVADRHLAVLRAAADAVYGTTTSIELGVDHAFAPPDVFDDPPTNAEPAPRRDPAPGEALPAPAPVQDMKSRLIAKYTFENFVVGQSNRFAHAAAMAVAEQPGSHYNPLFIHGGAGLGKTHLLHAVGHHRRELAPGSVVRYVSSEQFFNEFINGIRRKQMAEFKARYRTIDVLLLDDVQFFEGKEQILEEFFHTFNTLYETGRQLVFSADRPPKSLSSLEDRIRSRFEWGLTTDIQPPDVETRLAILRKNAAFAPQVVPEPVLDFMANRVVDNIRELEGALTRVTAYAALTHQPIDLEMAEDVLQDLGPAYAAVPISPGRILAATSESFGVSITELEGPSRRQPLARARQVAMYLIRELTDLSLPKIGQLFGGRDHTTVLHGVNTVAKAIKTDLTLFDRVTALLQSLRRT